jgi:hypothetical protein
MTAGLSPGEQCPSAAVRWKSKRSEQQWSEHGTVALLTYLVILCYLLELFLVVPGLLLRPSFRQPHPIVAAAVGIAISWVLPADRQVIDGHGFWASAAPATAAASGLLFALLARTQAGGHGRVPD